MNLKTVSLSTAVILFVCAVYGFLIWSGLQADKMREQELNINSLQNNVAELSKVQQIVQEGLSQDVRTLEDDVGSASADNKELILELNERLSGMHSSLSAGLATHVERQFEEVLELHEEIEDLPGLVDKLRT